jgi:hypothetical protein
MAFFLRYTQTPQLDLEIGVSGHYNDEGEKEELDGLCGFELEAETIEEAIEEAQLHNEGIVYNFKSMGDIAYIFEGKFLDFVPDGHVFEPAKFITKVI